LKPLVTCSAALAAAFAVALLAASGSGALVLNAPRMEPVQLEGLIASGSVTVIDVRAGASWDESNLKLPGAVRENPLAVETWMSKYAKDQTIVLYCS